MRVIKKYDNPERYKRYVNDLVLLSSIVDKIFSSNIFENHGKIQPHIGNPNDMSFRFTSSTDKTRIFTLVLSMDNPGLILYDGSEKIDGSTKHITSLIDFLAFFEN